MAFELKQHLKLAQQLVMTPQLQQAIKLLQLSRLELVDLIRQEIKENPILEEIPDPAESRVSEETQIKDEFNFSAEKERFDYGTRKDEPPNGSSGESDFDWKNYLYDSAKTPWDNLSQREEDDDGDEDLRFMERNLTKKKRLQDYLVEQLSLLTWVPEEEECARLIVGNLDNNGYLTSSLEELTVLSGLSVEQVEAVLKRVQKFDPPGVAARNLQECLLLQLSQVAEKEKSLIEQILSRHINNLAAKKYGVIAKDLHVPQSEIIQAVKTIQTLEPKPGRAFVLEEPQYINPDLYVYKIDGNYVVVLNEDGLPKLHINSFYRQVLTDSIALPAESKEYIQNKLRSAVWFIKSIYHRQNTIRNVMYSILKFQWDFFDRGIDYLKPLVLRDVAEDINMHESTVSRVTNNKYVHTAHGIFELKFFFNSSISSTSGDDVASESVKSMIRKIISAEDPRNPYSDQEIVRLLKSKDISIARRTVTKYREMMSILSSNRRKKVF